MKFGYPTKKLKWANPFLFQTEVFRFSERPYLADMFLDIFCISIYKYIAGKAFGFSLGSRKYD